MKQEILIKVTLFSIFSFFGNFLLSQTFVSGNTYFDATGYVEYRAGNLPIVISVPHGGDLEPATIPDRTSGTLVKDAWTKTIGEGLYDAFFEQTGCYPHLIINLLHRKKFDANRDIGEAADGNPTVEQAWYGYHEFIDSAKVQITEDYERGLFLDIHGHAHTIQRIELGYLLSGSELRLNDATLNTNAYIEENSTRTLISDNLGSIVHSELLRGENSFGTLLDDKGFPAVPSLTDPFPEVDEPYFSGGYNTVRHGSRDNMGDIDAIQLELNQDVRFNSTNRAMLIDSLTKVTNAYFDIHFNDQYLGSFCNLILPIELSNFTTTKQKQTVILEWETLREVNNDYFAVQKRTNRTSFKTIGKLTGKGNSAEINNYEYTDDAPSDGKNYYRLKQVDTDGKVSYSEVKHVDFFALDAQNFTFYPNPTSADEVRLWRVYSEKNEFSLSVYDISGRLVLHQIHSIIVGENDLHLDFSVLKPGIYFVKFETEYKQLQRKLVID